MLSSAQTKPLRLKCVYEILHEILVELVELELHIVLNVQFEEVNSLIESEQKFIAIL